MMIRYVKRRRLGGYAVYGSPYLENQNRKIQIANEKLKDRLPVFIEAHGGGYPLRLVSVPSEHTLIPYSTSVTI